MNSLSEIPVFIKAGESTTLEFRNTFNPCRLYGNLTVNDLLSGNYISQTRNKLIAKAFKEVGLIERYGSGIRRIINICKVHGIIEPVFEEKPNGFMVTIFKEKLRKTDGTENDTDHDTDHGTARKKRIIELLKENPKITIKKLAKELEVSRSTVIRAINSLRAEHTIKRVGGEKNGYWSLINE